MADDPIQLNSFLLEKTDKKVQYREAPDKMGWACGDCRFFSYNRCSLVEGSIEPSFTCDLWTEKMPSQTAPSGMMYSEEDGFQVFIEATEALSFKADKKLPDWIPFLPKPGKFKHPLYGELEITAEQNQQMVDSVNNVVYQEHIPLDAEHETKLSGAVGWIQKMRLNDDKSADAFIEWTDRGKSLVNGGGFKYVSPEWFSKWTDPATGTVHKNVVAGGAITTRPFFKDKALRALVASEAGIQVIQSDKETNVPNAGDPTPTPTPTPTPPTEPAPGSVTMTEAELNAKIEAAKAEAIAEVKKAAETKPEADPKESKEFTELNDRVVAAEALAAAEKTAREQMAATITALQNERRHERFVELVAGRGGETDGAAWPGDQLKHVEMLEKLSDQFGETDPVVAGYVENQKAIAAQMSSSLFREIGSGASGGGAGGANDPEAKIEALAQARMKEDKTLSYAKAYTEAVASPEGVRLYEADRQSKLSQGR